MNYARLLGAGAAATVAYFLYGGLVEGLLIAEDFRPYTGVYRSRETVMRYFPLGIACTFIAIVVMAAIYAKGYEGGSGLAEGARFGVLMAIFVTCTVVAHNYVILNIGGKLAAELAVSTLVQWTLVGTVIGLVYQPLAAAAR